jgi:hypothetical protein
MSSLEQVSTYPPMSSRVQGMKMHAFFSGMPDQREQELLYLNFCRLSGAKALYAGVEKSRTNTCLECDGCC